MPKLINNIEVLLCSLLSAKFTRWSSSIVWKICGTAGTLFKYAIRLQSGVGCTEVSFIILESINRMLERGSKVFGCFLDVRKAFDTV